jgi:hypothetical protein
MLSIVITSAAPSLRDSRGVYFRAGFAFMFFKPSKGGGERILKQNVIYYYHPAYGVAYPLKGANFLPDLVTTLYANNWFWAIRV